jgi:hypothetical protein
VFSTRYAPAICVALLLALVPTIIHSYAGVVASDGLTTKAIPATLAGYSSVPTKRSDDWGERHFDSHDWFERQYSRPDDTVVLTVVRSYDLKSLYHHPELAVAYHFASFGQTVVGALPERPEIPVHVLSGGDSKAAGLYVLHYDGRFISDPIAFQLRTAGELLVSGRKPMTLLFVRDDAPSTGDPLKLPAAQLLLAAIQAFTRGSGG